MTGKSVIVQMDANSKLGSDLIKGDPQEQSPNGKLLADIISRHSLAVLNAHNQCTGTITRRRI